MSIMDSWCERLFLISFIALILIFITDYNLQFLPLHGLSLFIYIICLILSTIWVTVLKIQKLFQKNTPFDYNFKPRKSFHNAYELFFNYINQELGKSSDTLTEESDLNIDERIELLVGDIEEKFISKWYKTISKEDIFIAECKILVEGIIRRILQVSVQIDSAKLMRGVLIILLKHLKEYRKALRRVEKHGGSIENVYKYSHIGNKNQATLEHFVHRLTANITREFISWELWNSLPCRLFVSILSKKLITYLIFYISQPGWLNYKILEQFATESDIKKYQLDKYLYVSLSDVDLIEKLPDNDKVENEMNISCTPDLSPKKDVKITTTYCNSSASDSESVIEQALGKMIKQQTAPILQRAENVVENGKTSFQPKRSEPVKIHSGKSSKQWNEIEVNNISIGEDLLALESLNSSELQGFSGRRLWGYNSDLNEEMEKFESNGNETKAIRKDLKEISPPHCITSNSATAFVNNTIKPIAGNVTATTLHNMRELQQSTVNNVMRPVSTATEKAIHKIGDLQDEACGVVEGIFDFGMAGIRKGLRLTGLQENKMENNVWINPLAKQETPNSFENQILLEKSPNLIDEDVYLTESPEYEETADLASTISKLRSLLQQKSSESSANTPAVSPMLFEDKSTPTMIEEIGKGDGGMQRFARTVTGMFNTLKTALPGSITEQNQNNTQWIFVENEKSELSNLLQSLLIERRDYCTIDTAYEAMDSLDLLTDSFHSQINRIQLDNFNYEDELEDLDNSIPTSKAFLDIICECLQDTNCAINQEPVIKALLILIGMKTEEILCQKAEKILRSINKIIGPLPKNQNENVTAFKLQEMVQIIENSLPYLMKQVFGEKDNRTGLKFFISSLQSPKINQDIILQIFQLICYHLIFINSQMSPTPSA